MKELHELEHLLARIALRDRAAFDALYSATSAKLFGVSLRVLNDRTEAEEALQDTYVKIWRNAGRYAANGLSPMTWLITIARNSAIDRLRARKGRDRGETGTEEIEQIADGALSAEDRVIAASESARIAECLGELEADRAGAVQGAYLRGESYNDLAARYGVPLNTMRTWLRRSLLKLKDCMSR